MPDFPDLRSLGRPASVSVTAAPGRDKAEVRAAVTAARRSMPAEVRAEADAAIVQALIGLIRSHSRDASSVIAAYAPMPGEPGGVSLPAALAAGRAARRLLLPVLRPDLDLDWAEHSADLVPGRFGLREPGGARLGVRAIGEAVLVIVPALAVAADGVRLGRGGGSYDRALARVAPSALVIAPLYDGELVDALPAEPHDRPVHVVVTPAGTCELASTGRNGSR